MSPTPNLSPAPRRRDPLALAALLVALLSLVFSMSGLAPARRQSSHAKPHRHAHKHAHRRKRARRASLAVRCPVTNSIDLGTWCLESGPHFVPPEDAGKTDYFYATQTCVADGGWLPSAAQLIGAATKAALQSTLDDDPATSGAEETPEAERGIKDKREMSADLFTVSAGPDAAGSEGVSAGSRGSTDSGEPDPVPLPANPAPGTLDYVTVYDNHNMGGFAGGEPVGKSETFRCAYAKGSQRVRKVEH